ncbi:MAG: hypothetical protein ACM3II_17895 [Rhodospirillaceae bacterium]
MPAPARPTVTLRGTLAVEVVRRGTASEQRALVLASDAGERLLLVKLGGPSFGLPPEARLAGRRVEVEGYRLDGELRFTRLAEL